MTTILVGTDTSAAADLAVEGAARLARAQGAEPCPAAGASPTAISGRWWIRERAADPDRHLTTLRARFPELSDDDPHARRATRPNASAPSPTSCRPTRSWWATAARTATGGG